MYVSGSNSFDLRNWKKRVCETTENSLVLVLENISAVSIISFLSGRNTVDFGGDFDANSLVNFRFFNWDVFKV